MNDLFCFKIRIKNSGVISSIVNSKDFLEFIYILENGGSIHSYCVNAIDGHAVMPSNFGLDEVAFEKWMPVLYPESILSSHYQSAKKNPQNEEEEKRIAATLDFLESLPLDIKYDVAAILYKK